MESNANQIVSADISSYPEISTSNPLFYNHNGEQEGFLSILKSNGVNTIRMRLWVNPLNDHSSLKEVSQFSRELCSMGFDIYLALHYSDTWAHPGQQETPAAWQWLSKEALADTVYAYTSRVLDSIPARYVQIGNEINTGLLFPHGSIENSSAFMDILDAGISSVRDHSEDIDIILQYAGIEGSSTFFDRLNNLDYDIIGLSYYPLWHGKSLDLLKSTMLDLGESFNKKTLIAETAYPFTLEWNDWTNNIVGLESQLILPEYPATMEGQKRFIKELSNITADLSRGIGFSYWGGELISWKGSEATDGSPWENQALFDFTNNALPALEAFQ